MPVPESKIRQLLHQSDTWKRDIEFLMQENVILKNRLAEIISANRITPELLERAEEYQAQFLTKDEFIRFIRSEIAELDNLLVQQRYRDEKGSGEKVTAMHKKIAAQTEAVTKDFMKLKFSFNNYMNEVL